MHRILIFNLLAERSHEVWYHGSMRLAQMEPSITRDYYIRYMNVFQRGWDYTIANDLMTLRPAWNRK